MTNKIVFTFLLSLNFLIASCQQNNQPQIDYVVISDYLSERNAQLTPIPADKNNKANQSSEVEIAKITAVTATYPVRLSNINIKDSKVVPLSKDVTLKINELIKAYYFNDCAGDSSQTYFKIKDVYLNTICLQDSLQTLYWVLLHHLPTGKINSKVLFQNKQTKQFSKTIFDLNIYALYDLQNEKLKPTNLKNEFKITIPEIELIDFNNDGINDYMFTRLYHNGSANAIETTILKVRENKIDTLYFKQDFEELNRPHNSRKIP